MTHNEIIRMAREAGLLSEDEAWVSPHQESMKRFAALVAAAEEARLMQIFTDPENQPSQFGTVTLEYMQQEVEAEREALRVDAERYRWLRDFDEDPVMSLAARYTDMHGSAISISLRIDAAIDAARSKT